MKRVNGPTPAGGSYSEARAFDLSGTETDDLAAATYVRIDEFDEDGVLLQRTHAGSIIDDASDRTARQSSTVSAGEANDPYNTDLTKATWDIRRPEDQALVDNLLDLIDVLFPDRPDETSLRRDLAAFTAVPAYEAAPVKLRRELEAYLAG